MSSSFAILISLRFMTFNLNIDLKVDSLSHKLCDYNFSSSQQFLLKFLELSAPTFHYYLGISFFVALNYKIVSTASESNSVFFRSHFSQSKKLGCYRDSNYVSLAHDTKNISIIMSESYSVDQH